MSYGFALFCPLLSKSLMLWITSNIFFCWFYAFCMSWFECRPSSSSSSSSFWIFFECCFSFILSVAFAFKIINLCLNCAVAVKLKSLARRFILFSNFPACSSSSFRFSFWDRPFLYVTKFHYFAICSNECVELIGMVYWIVSADI